LPTMIWREGRRAMSRQGRTDMTRHIVQGVTCAKAHGIAENPVIC
jgi:hypothetical protein